MNRTLTSTAALSLLCLTVAGCSSSDTPAAKPQATSSSTASTGTVVPLPNATSPKGTASASPSVDCSDTSLDMAEWTANCAGQATQPGVDVEGSVTTEDGSFVQYPNGIREEIVKVERDHDFGRRNQDPNSDHPDYDEGLHITVKLTNNGTQPYDVAKFNTKESLTFGENWLDAAEYSGHLTLPNRLVPGSSAEQTYDYTVPSASAGDTLRLTVNPDSTVFTDYTFTEVETLLN